MSKLIKSFNVCLSESEKVEITDYVSEENEDAIDFQEEDIENAEETPDEVPESITKKYEKIIANAEKEAKEIIDNALLKVDEEREIILEQAKKNGYEDGMNQAMKHCEDIIEETALIKEQTLHDAKIFLDNIEDEVVTIVIDIARKVVGAEISFSKEDIIYIVKEALINCTQREKVVIKVSEDDFEVVNHSKSKLMAMAQGIGEIEIKLDHSLKSGGCILETPYGAIDAGVETRLSQIEKVFRGLVGRE